MKDRKLFTVGFYSEMEPFMRQTWRPKKRDREECNKAEAGRRFDKLRRSMRKGKKVDGLIVSGIWIRNERTGSFVRSMAQDETEAPQYPGDLESLAMPIRPKC